MPMKTEHLLVIGYVVTISAIILTFVFMRKRLSSPAKSAESNAIDNTTTQKGGKDKKKKKKARALARMRNRRTGESDDEEPELPDLPENDHGKIAKSVRKKAEKAAAKRMRAEEVQAREEKMEKQRQKDDERAALRDEKQRERERMEAEEEEEERKKRELELAQEEAEFKDWEGMFELESAGSGEADAKEQEGGLSAFIDNIKKQKVVVLDDLAAEYGMRTTAVVNRIEHLEKAGQLTGVLDDRGKFIYITPEELEAVAKFIEEKGRVTIADVVQESNRLIDLTEKNEIVLDEEDDEEEEAQAQTQ